MPLTRRGRPRQPADDKDFNVNTMPPTTREPSETPTLEVSSIRKRFPGVLALDDVDMRIMPGEARALAGQNGSGKSTLIKVVAGVHPKDYGTIRIQGKEVEPRTPAEAVGLGISTIHQEVNLIPLRSIAENLFLAREPKLGPFIRQKQLLADAEELLARYGLENVDPRIPLYRLSIAMRQMVAIIRAVSQDAQLVIMDEPTSSLEIVEVERLFAISQQLLSEGRSVIFVSHRLEELFEVCTTATVLRDGKLVYDGDLGALTKNELIVTMIGRDRTYVAGRSTGFRDRARVDRTPLFTAKSIENADLKGVTVDIGSGEIVGLAGLLGAGRTEFAEAIFGLQRRTAGSGALGDREVLPKTPMEALSQGMALVPEDRRAQGILPGQSVKDNLVAAIMPSLTRRGIVDRIVVNRIVQEFVQALEIKLVSVDQPIEQLSGGNQQKVILARSLSLAPRLLIADEPTRGIDVGAKYEIQSLISDLADEGMAVLLISSELEELLEGTERTVVMRDGHSVEELSGESLTEQHLVELMAGPEEDSP